MRLASFVSLLCLLLKGFQTIEATDTSNNSPYRILAPNNADFAFRLFENLVTLNPNKDVFISPMSISMALSLLILGSSGQTHIKLFNGLGLDISEMSEYDIRESFRLLYEFLRLSDRSLVMSMGSTLFHKQTLNIMTVFPVKPQNYYGLDNFPLGVQAWTKTSSQINEYVKNKTHGEISGLVLEIENPATIILINYIFFSGTWEQAFSPEDTRLEDFFVDNTTVVQVPMMFQSNIFKYLYDSELECMVVQLEYMGNITAFFILPDNKNMDIVIQELNQDTLRRWDTSMISSNNVDLYIPKLSLSGLYDLGEITKALSLRDLKNSQTDSSKYSSIVQTLSKVVYNSNLQLSENGQAAPSKTSSRSVGRKLLAPTIRFNHPFIIMVFNHTSWSCLFLGKVMNPQESTSHGKP
ncbi:corticosteroid-binding globulin-like [Sorex araneus]|uniref:corticosteroid-binding globulin-like n=1 Tax=Sorex araneus TaxID=42254 RepID=UPI00243405C8|nr:corticosteroid-binding globulin-like [Sorex araneus]